jgi:hypothetical protein
MEFLGLLVTFCHSHSNKRAIQSGAPTCGNAALRIGIYKHHL